MSVRQSPLAAILSSLLLLSLLLSLASSSTSFAAGPQNGSQQQQQQQVAPASNNNNQLQQPSSSGQPAVVVASGAAKARYKTMYACEDRQLTMDCDFGSKINLIRANYGRFSITQCNEQGQLDLSTDCMSPITFRIMRERCQDRQKCSVNATSSIFGDKCPRTRKYLEVHFQCQHDPRVMLAETLDRVDLRNSSQVSLASQQQVQHQHQHQLQHQTYFQAPIAALGSGSILPPNNPTNLYQPQQLPPALQTPPSSGRQQTAAAAAASQPELAEHIQFRSQPQVQQPQQQQQQPMTVMNSEILSFNALADPRPFYGQNANTNTNTNLNLEPTRQVGQAGEPIVVTLRHTHTENMSNPRCVLWDQAANQWTERGSQIIESNLTHTVCAFDQATSYLLVMDYLVPHQTVSVFGFGSKTGRALHLAAAAAGTTSQQTTNPNQTNRNQISQQNQLPIQQIQPQPQLQLATQPPVPQISSPYPGILDLQPVVLDPQQQLAMNKANQQQQQPPQQQQQSGSALTSIVRFFSLFGYLLAFVFITVAFMTIAFVASSMRSSAGAALKSLGNFAAFPMPKYKGRRQDGSSHNKDLLVINNQNGHQFLYAPATTTKISSSASTHILAGAVPGQYQGSLHQIQQQQQHQMYSANGTLSNLSGAGGQSNNYYYGLMGLSPFFQQQQQQQQSQLQHHLSQHHLNSQHQVGNQQVASSTPTSYHHQANKSTVSSESSNSTPSSSGVESGSASMQQQQHMQLHQQPASCLVMNSDYNLMSHLGNYGQHQSLLSGQPTLTLNAHYSPSGVAAGLSPQQQQQQQRRLANSSLREHIYECVEDDKPYTARLLLPTNMEAGEQQQLTFGASTLAQQQQQVNSSRAMTFSSRMLHSAIQQQQQAAASSQQASKRLPSHPAIVRDNQTKTNIICSKLAQVSPQRATEINKFQHDVMAIYNGSNDTTTTATTAAAAANTTNQKPPSGSVGGYLRQELAQAQGVDFGSKLSTDC